jgi:hypothetical protein
MTVEQLERTQYLNDTIKFTGLLSQSVNSQSIYYKGIQSQYTAVAPNQVYRNIPTKYTTKA